MLILGILVFPVFVIGPQQYGYAFFGLCSLLGQIAKIMSAEGPIWAMILNLGIIGVMILFSVSGLSALLSSIVVALLSLKEKTRKRMKLPPVFFAGMVLLGLAAFEAFPGEPKIEIGGEFYFGPSLLLLVSIFSFITKDKTEQGSGINSVTAPPPLRDTL